MTPTDLFAPVRIAVADLEASPRIVRSNLVGAMARETFVRADAVLARTERFNRRKP